MLASLSRASRLALVLLLSTGYVASYERTAWADGDEDDDSGGGDDDGDEKPGAGEGEDGEGEGEGEAEEEDKDQPPVTAGGLFTLKTYPVRELFRPLTMTEKVTQLRLALGSDVSDKTAFKFFGVSLDAKYGYADNFMLLGGFTSDYNFKGFALSAGFEGALAYDKIGIRLTANVNRVAVVSEVDVDGMTFKPTDFKAGAGTQFSVAVGFPFRYVAKPEIAIVALETLLEVDFNAIKRGDGGGNRGMATSCFAAEMVDAENCTEDGVKPDLAPSIGIATNPIDALSVVVLAQLLIRDFDTTNQFTVPATVRVEYSPSQKFDIGLEFKFLDMKPKDPDGEGPAPAPKFFDQRFLNMFIQARY
jgi:hypothetical protein